MIEANPYQGVGLGHFAESVDQYVDKPLPENHPRDAHNAFLLTAAELGLPGLAIMVLNMLALLTLALLAMAPRAELLAQKIEQAEWIIEPLRPDGWAEYNPETHIAVATNGVVVKYRGAVLVATFDGVTPISTPPQGDEPELAEYERVTHERLPRRLSRIQGVLTTGAGEVTATVVDHLGGRVDASIQRGSAPVEGAAANAGQAIRLDVTVRYRFGDVKVDATLSGGFERTEFGEESFITRTLSLLPRLRASAPLGSRLTPGRDPRVMPRSRWASALGKPGQ